MESGDGSEAQGNPGYPFMELHVARMQIPNGASMNLAPTHFINGVEDKVEAHKELLRRVVDKQ